MKRIKFKPCKFCKQEVRTTQRKCPFCNRYLHEYTSSMTDLERNKEIVRQREQGKTLRELSQKYNLSQERIRQIQRNFK